MALVQLSSRFERSLQGASGVDWLGKLDVEQLWSLTRLIGSYGQKQSRRLPQKAAFAANLQSSWCVSTIAAEVLNDWPKSFHLYLERLVQPSSGSAKAGSLPRVFGGLYLALYRVFKAPAFDELRDQFEAFVMEHWTGALGNRNSRFREHILEQATWLPAGHVCKAVGISRRRLDLLVASGALRGESRTSLKGRRFLVVHRDAIEKLKPSIESEVTLIQAATRLGFKRSRFASILSAICPLACRHADEQSPWSIPGRWLEDWLSRLDRHQITHDQPGLVCLKDVLRFWAWPDDRVARLLMDVADEKILPAGRVTSITGIPSLLFNERILRAWVRSDVGVRTDLTIPEVADRLDIKQEVAYLIVRRGLLASATRRLSGRSAAMVHESDLHIFRKNYVWARDVAATMKRSPKAMAANLVLAGATPVSGPLIDGGRQLLFRRDQVENLLQIRIPLYDCNDEREC